MKNRLAWVALLLLTAPLSLLARLHGLMRRLLLFRTLLRQENPLIVSLDPVEYASDIKIC